MVHRSFVFFFINKYLLLWVYVFTHIKAATFENVYEHVLFLIYFAQVYFLGFVGMFIIHGHENQQVITICFHDFIKNVLMFTTALEFKVV